MSPVDSPGRKDAGSADERAAAPSTSPIQSAPLYVPPTGDEPLDAVQQALVRMWIDIIENKIRADLAATPPDEQDGISAATTDATRLR